MSIKSIQVDIHKCITWPKCMAKGSKLVRKHAYIISQGPKI